MSRTTHIRHVSRVCRTGVGALVTRNDERVKERTFSRERLEGKGEGEDEDKSGKSSGYVRRKRNPEKKVPGCTKAGGEESGGETWTMKGEKVEWL